MQIADLTVILPTRNERYNIRGFLASLPDAVSLIVVDASDDDTPQLVRDIRPDCTTIIQQPCNVVTARQIGAQVASTPWLLFTDADVVFSLSYFNDLARIDVSESERRRRAIVSSPITAGSRAPRASSRRWASPRPPVRTCSSAVLPSSMWAASICA